MTKSKWRGVCSEGQRTVENARCRSYCESRDTASGFTRRTSTSRRTCTCGKAGKEAKYWMAPIALAKSSRFREHELSEIEGILAEHQNVILRAWQEEHEKRGNR